MYVVGLPSCKIGATKGVLINWELLWLIMLMISRYRGHHFRRQMFQFTCLVIIRIPVKCEDNIQYQYWIQGIGKRLHGMEYGSINSGS